MELVESGCEKIELEIFSIYLILSKVTILERSSVCLKLKIIKNYGNACHCSFSYNEIFPNTKREGK